MMSIQDSKKPTYIDCFSADNKAGESELCKKNNWLSEINLCTFEALALGFITLSTRLKRLIEHATHLPILSDLFSARESFWLLEWKTVICFLLAITLQSLLHSFLNESKVELVLTRHFCIVRPVEERVDKLGSFYL